MRRPFPRVKTHPSRRLPNRDSARWCRLHRYETSDTIGKFVANLFACVSQRTRNARLAEASTARLRQIYRVIRWYNAIFFGAL
ncbi:hypothetical protein IAQ61_001115 [Plenodomus lingam]|uniref:uncharacterized protein n=1 Tax=Leptosphaeria maculans TaxID=5022 RepID=UPI00332A43B6|nr:hypothetical protein IAQ61_001115 [Plenodomus lingam]